jgi:hypothetical protein
MSSRSILLDSCVVCTRTPTRLRCSISLLSFTPDSPCSTAGTLPSAFWAMRWVIVSLSAVVIGYRLQDVNGDITEYVLCHIFFFMSSSSHQNCASISSITHRYGEFVGVRASAMAYEYMSLACTLHIARPSAQYLTLPQGSTLSHSLSLPSSRHTSSSSLLCHTFIIPLLLILRDAVKH